MIRVPLTVVAFGLTLFAFGCEARQGDDCSALCTQVFEDCDAGCDEDEDCTLTCEGDSNVCIQACDDEDDD